MSDIKNENLGELIPGGAPLENRFPAVPAPVIGSVVLPCAAPPTFKLTAKLRDGSNPGGAPQESPIPDDRRSKIMIDGKLIAEVPTRTVLWLTKLIEVTVPFLPTLVPFERRQEFRGVPVPSKTGAKGRKVRVSMVEENCDQPHQVGDIFDSASSASASVGLTANALCIAMRNAGGRGETLAKLRGVTFQYDDDYQQEINGEGRASD